VTGGNLAQPMLLAAGQSVTLPAGPSYAIVSPRVKSLPAAGLTIGKAFYLSATTFAGCIKSGATVEATVTYTLEPGSEKIWMTVSNPPTDGRVIAGFNGADVAASGAHTPSVWKSKNFTGRGSAGAFDADGNLWMPGGDRINMYAMATLAMSGETEPEVALTQPDGVSANFAAFDVAGNLWISRGAPTAEISVVRYSVADQAVTGSPTPGVVLTSPALANPSGLAFDAAGNLWVASEGNGSVVKFNAARLAASYSGAPDRVLKAQTVVEGMVTGDFSNPIPLAFDRTGNLWVGFLDNVVKFTPAHQAGTDAAIVNPLAVKTSTFSIAFDEAGGVWVDDGTSTFRHLPAAGLATGGEITADIAINSDELGGVEKLLINPSPTWATLNDGPRAP
jgi:hypothetical protein